MGFAQTEKFETILQLSNEDAAYLAGLIDADGTISAQVNSQRNRDGSRRMPVPMVLVVNTDLELIAWLKKVIGYGCSHETKAKPTRPGQNMENWRPVHRFQITGRSAITLVGRVRPYLRVKAEKADLMVRFPCRGKDYSHKASKEQRKMAYDILNALRKLNKRR